MHDYLPPLMNYYCDHPVVPFCSLIRYQYHPDDDDGGDPVVRMSVWRLSSHYSYCYPAAAASHLFASSYAIYRGVSFILYSFCVCLV